MPTPKRVPTRDFANPPRIDFDVTQKHIDEAIPRDSGHCMIADALRDAYPRATYISVDLATIRFTDEAAGLRYIYLTPGYAQKALIDWDDGTKPEPFHIRQRCAQVVMTAGARRKRRDEQDSEERTDAFLIQNADASERSVPVKAGGTPPPTAPLRGVAPQRGRPARGQDQRGKRREFGLRRFIR